MIRRPPGSTRTYTLFPYTTLFRSVQLGRDPHHEIAAERPVGRKPFLGAKREVIVNAVAEGLCQFIGRGAGESHHRSEEHTSELQSLMRISYAVFCLKKKKKMKTNNKRHHWQKQYNYQAILNQ